MKTVIGLLGRSGVGKSTVARYMEDAYNAKCMGFVDPVREIAASLFGFSMNDLRGSNKQQVKSTSGISGREALENTGYAVRSALGTDILINELSRRIHACSENLVVIDDMRKPNEVAFIRNSTDFRGFVLKLERPGFVTDANPNSSLESCVDTVEPSLISAILHFATANDQQTSIQQMVKVVDTLLQDILV